MPKSWLYYFALVLPFVFGTVIIRTGVVDWLWYQHYEKAYYALAALRVQPQFVEFVGGFALPVFILTVISWWHLEDGESMPLQFLLLPLAYVPFAIVANILVTANFEPSNLYTYPLIIIPFGYIYVIAWTILIWLLGKIGLVIS